MTPSVVCQASVLSLSAVRPARWLVRDHYVAPVQERPLSLDPTKAVRELLSCEIVAGTANFTHAPIALLSQALAKMFEVLVGAHLKTTQIWGSPAAPRPVPSPWFEFEPDRLKPESSSNQGG